MKTIIIILGCLLLCTGEVRAQHTKQKVKVHKVWVTLLDGLKIKGNLYSADELGIKVANSNTIDIASLTTINAANIDELKIRRKGRIGNSILIGGLSGAGLSILLGATTNDTGFFTKGEVMALSGILFVPLGSGIGALAGTKKENFNIGGEMGVYQSVLIEIQSYSMQQTNMLTNNSYYENH